MDIINKTKTTSERFLDKYGIRKRYDIFDVRVPYYFMTKDLTIQVNKNIDLYHQKAVHILMFSQGFNEPVTPDKIPDSVKVLIFGTHFNQDLDNLPHNIEVIIFPSHSRFNQMLNNLPINMKAILFGKNFTQALDFLPPSVVFIEFPLYSNYSTIVFPPYF